jgi:cytochrome c oxidase subunit 2
MQPKLSLLLPLAAATAIVSALVVRAADAPAGDEKVIKVVAQKFHYTPAEITIKRGEDVTLEFTSLDFVHGFKVPDLGLRVDLPPGKVTRVHVKADKVGNYDFLCDNFCGSGHEEMNGRIVVVE